MKNLAIIPARSGSKGLKDKNIKLLNGKPLLAYSIEAAKKSELFDEIMVSTDSQEYANIAKQWGANVPFLRNNELSNDTASSWDVVKDVICQYKNLGFEFETVTLLQPTSPLRSGIDINKAYQVLEDKNANFVVSVCEMDHSPLWSNIIPESGLMDKFINEEIASMPRQKLPKYYRINGALYVIKVEHLMNSDKLYDKNTYSLVMDKDKSIDIDSEFDFKMAEFLISKNIESKNLKSILITGGAGYIGSHTVKYFQKQNEEIIVVDNMQSGHEYSLDVEHLYKIDIRDKFELDKIFKKHKIEAVIHFAANSLVGESMEKPYEYYHNNVYGMMCLLDVMRENNVKKIVFSSTAATYGEPKNIPILESDETTPTNTYGETKLAMEKMMKWFDEAYGIKYVSLRYFNAAGAYETGEIGEDHNPETHLIPLILQVALGKSDKIYMFGDDYQTEDGTCVRDYIHVMDLALAHYKALEYLRKENHSDIFNLGNGSGYSVKEVIDMARKVTEHEIRAEVKERRAGDPAILIASSEKAKSVLGWEPEFNSLEKIIKDAWRWHKNNPNGYKIK